MTSDGYIQVREEVARIPKSQDVDVRVSLLEVAGVSVLEVQDVTRSTGHVGRGWYVSRDSAGRQCAGELAAVLSDFCADGLVLDL